MSSLKIGWAWRDISTTGPVNLPGQFHMRISEGILDPLTVTALVLDSGEDMAIFLSGDMVVCRWHLLDEVRAETVRKNPEIPVEKILENATHAHTGASHYDDEFEFPHDDVEIMTGQEYRKFLVEQASDAVCEAYETRKEGGIAWGYGYAVVAHSRRVVYFDDTSKRPGAVINSTHGVNGHAQMYGNTSDPMFSHYEAGADHFLNLLFTFDEEDRLTGAIVNIPCPSQNTENLYKLSADYWHDVRLAIREKFGNIFILPQCAAAGDLSPRILHYREAQDRRFRLKYGIEPEKGVGKFDTKGATAMCERKDIAERVAWGFEEVYSWARKDIRRDVKIGHIVRTVDLPKRLISDEEYAYAVEGLDGLKDEKWKTDGTPMENLTANSQLVSGRNRFQQIIDRYEAQKTEKTIPMEMHVIQVGDVAFASNRFEIYMDYQHRIQARSPFEQTFIVQLAAQPGVGGGSYLCTERGAWGRGYSASMFCNQVSYEAGQVIVEETLKSLNELKGENK